VCRSEAEGICPAKRVVLTNGWVVGHSDTEVAASATRLDANFVVDCATNPLLAAKVSLSCLNGNVLKQELDLFEFAAGCVT